MKKRYLITLMLSLLVIVFTLISSIYYVKHSGLNLLNISQFIGFFGDFPLAPFGKENILIEVPLLFILFNLVFQCLIKRLSNKKILIMLSLNYMVHIMIIYSVMVLSIVYFPIVLSLGITLIITIHEFFWIKKNIVHKLNLLSNKYNYRIDFLQKIEPYVFFAIVYFIFIFLFFIIAFGSGPGGV